MVHVFLNKKIPTLIVETTGKKGKILVNIYDRRVIKEG